MSPDVVALVSRVHVWDERVEKGIPPYDEQAERPFEAGLHLAACKVLESWESGDLAGAVHTLQETLEAIVDG